MYAPNSAGVHPKWREGSGGSNEDQERLVLDNGLQSVFRLRLIQCGDLDSGLWRCVRLATNFCRI